MKSEDNHVEEEPGAPKPLSLEELLRGVTDDNIPREWDTGPVVGQEIW